MRRKLKLTITKIRRQSFGEQRAAPIRFLCQICGAETEMLTVAESTAFLEIKNRPLESLIADGKIHAARTASGNLRICKNSLFQENENFTEIEKII